jgi:ABC-type lipoprotein export system ATPase subunit
MSISKASILGVENLKCAYPNGPVVLDVKQFSLNKGEIVFLLGSSGIGKSTFIEAVGLINNTGVHENDARLSFRSSHENEIDLLSLWSESHEVLESFRRNHFSFIFQNNYLMPNLTAGENMMLTLLMKGHDEVSARDEVIKYMEVVKLKEEVFNKSIQNLSGGQKQRLAFVRAIASPFDILIGDEPTGNLDPVTANVLMDFIQMNIKKTGKSAIFVSHDIQLALSFADRIYMFTPMEKSKERYVGVLNEDNLIHKQASDWYFKDEQINDPYLYLYNKFSELV